MKEFENKSELISTRFIHVVITKQFTISLLKLISGNKCAPMENDCCWQLLHQWNGMHATLIKNPSRMVEVRTA